LNCEQRSRARYWLADVDLGAKRLRSRRRLETQFHFGCDFATLEFAAGQGYVPGRHIPHDPAALLSLMPVVVRQVGTEDAVEQIVKLFISRASIFGNVDPNLPNIRTCS
jgi:hypothetical protein